MKPTQNRTKTAAFLHKTVQVLLLFSGIVLGYAAVDFLANHIPVWLVCAPCALAVAKFCWDETQCEP